MELEFPKRSYNRFKALCDEAWALPTEDWLRFWDEICETMEEKLKELKR